ncbi:Snaclec coagulation factor IX/factor X-binding protein subunit B [Holothuria leucospilota]|uniref:Snaclec coagulation factor IX/factor X-binding protein subunit B n=1 Tax=Holothuria leucospilota TaxID=206669 RepID=A0A9Q1BBT9_HOLLE|nr:Snaclec coagulation factor IX/factor X-binding protein subunit B [Holothuria leucospilota]
MEVKDFTPVILASVLIFTEMQLAAAEEKKLVVFPKPFFSSNLEANIEPRNQNVIEETEEYTSQNTFHNTENDGTEKKPFECTPKDAVTTTEEQPTTTTAEKPATTTSGLTANEGCKSGWSAYNNSCYLFVQTKKRWEDAKSECFSHNSDAHLVFIESDTENDFVIHLIQSGLNATDGSSDVWLGLTYDWNKEIWKWDNTAADIPKEGPRAVEIGSSPEECVRIQTSNNLKWNDKECSESYFFICEILATQT